MSVVAMHRKTGTLTSNEPVCAADNREVTVTFTNNPGDVPAIVATDDSAGDTTNRGVLFAAAIVVPIDTLLSPLARVRVFLVRCGVVVAFGRPVSVPLPPRKANDTLTHEQCVYFCCCWWMTVFFR